MSLTVRARALVVATVLFVALSLAGAANSDSTGSQVAARASHLVDLGVSRSLAIAPRSTALKATLDRPLLSLTWGSSRLIVRFGVAAEAGGGAVKLLGPGTSYGAKIEKQLGKRGWTKRLVDSTIDDPVRTVRTRDTRHLPGGDRVDDPATVYYSGRGGYVVRNDRTGDVIQVSDRTDPGWKAPWGS